VRGLLNLSHTTTGFVAVLAGYTSSVAIIFQAALMVGASEAIISSWLWALGLGMGVTSIGLSLWFRAPVLTAWSTPGAALMVTGLADYTLAEAIGIFLFSSLLLTVVGLTGWFDRLMRHVPHCLAAAMLAGILVPFGMKAFVSLESDAVLVGVMIAVYLGSRRWLPRYAVPLSLLAGGAIAFTDGQLHSNEINWALSTPIWTTPEFNFQALIGVGVPLFIVTMASQNLPGIAVMRANGYQTPTSPVIATTGAAGLILAPFGGYTFNMAAITAAICMGKEAGPDPAQRYWAAVWAGIFYLFTGLFGATVAGLLAAFPGELILTIAGLALLATIGNSLFEGLKDLSTREAALITFLVTESGMTVGGVGSAFWGLVLGLIAYWVQPRLTGTTR